MRREVIKGRQDLEFNEGDKVFLRSAGDHFKSTLGTSKSLNQWYEGPFKIVKCVEKVAYRLQLPSHMHM